MPVCLSVCLAELTCIRTYVRTQTAFHLLGETGKILWGERKKERKKGSVKKMRKHVLDDDESCSRWGLKNEGDRYLSAFNILGLFDRTYSGQVYDHYVSW